MPDYKLFTIISEGGVEVGRGDARNGVLPEAVALARRNPGLRFYIMESIGYVATPALEPRFVETDEMQPKPAGE